MELRQKSVSVRIYRWLCEDARTNGIDPAALYETLGIGPAELADDTRRIAGDRHVAAMQLTSGWPLSWHRPPPQVVPWLVPFPELAGITCNAATLRGALHGYLRYRELITVLMAWVVHQSASIGSRRSLARAGAGRGRGWLRGCAGRSRRRRALRWQCSRVG